MIYQNTHIHKKTDSFSFKLLLKWKTNNKEDYTNKDNFKWLN